MSTLSRAARWLRRHGALLVAVAIPVLGVAECVAHVHFSNAAPDLAEWAAVRSDVERLVDPGTLLVVAPYWAEPNARHAFGDTLMPLEHVARADESSFETALEVGILGHTSELLRGWSVESEQRSGRFLLRRLRNPDVRPVEYDFLAHAEPEHLQVNVVRKGRSQACPYNTKAKVTNGDLGGHPTYPRQRFDCPGRHDWLFVGRTVIEDEQYRPRRCLWAHPPSKATLELTFAAVPLGREIRGHGGLPYLFAREGRGTPIELTVLVGDEVVGRWRHRDRAGWASFEFSTARYEGQTLPVTFRVASKKAWRRDFCFRAGVR